MDGKVVFGVFKADVLDHLAEEFEVAGDFSGFDVTADDVAEDAAEVFVPRIGQEAAGIGKHAYKVAQKACVLMSLHGR